MDFLIGNPDTMKRMVVVGVLSYLLLIMMLKISGKRTLSKMNAFDFIITVSLGSMLSTIILNPSISLFEGMSGIGLLILLQYIITFTSIRTEKIGNIIKSDPTLLFYNSEYFKKNMIKERVLKGELDQAIRQAGYSSYESISAVILEPDGTFSIIASEGSLIHSLDSVSDSPLNR